MKIFLVRHGEADAEVEDLHLTERGFLQAKEVALRLRSFDFSKVYSSDLLRAKQTAEEYLKTVSGKELIIDERLREIYRLVIGGPVREGTPVGREKEDRKRADEIFDEFLKEESDVVIFAHGNIIRYFINKVFESKKNLWNTLIIGEGSISILEFKEGKLQVNCINDKGHSIENEKGEGDYLE